MDIEGVEDRAFIVLTMERRAREHGQEGDQNSVMFHGFQMNL